MTETEFLIELGHRIRMIRKQKKISQVQLAEKLGTFHTQIGRIERGEVNATINMLRKIANELGISVSELVNI
jgi:transcriptional regulator with XRE-family HTH domain